MGGWRIQFLQPFHRSKSYPPCIFVHELVLIILPFLLMIIIMTVYVIETIKIMTELIEAQVAWIGIIVKCRDNLE